MHVGGDPHRVADFLTPDEREDVGELKLASARRIVVALRQRFITPLITLHSACEAFSCRFSQSTCDGAKKYADGP
jgi:hypothetical protein